MNKPVPADHENSPLADNPGDLQPSVHSSVDTDANPPPTTLRQRIWQHPEFAQGARDMLPVAPGIAAWGLMTGVAMMKSGLSLVESLAMALTVFAGSSQLASMPLIVAGAPIWVVLATGLCVNLRFVVFSIHLRPYVMHQPLWRRLVSGYFTADLSYVMFVKRFPHPVAKDNLASAPSGGSAAHAVASGGGAGRSDGPPLARPAPSGGSAAHAVASVGGAGRSDGPPLARPAPSGGSAAHAVASVGALLRGQEAYLAGNCFVNWVSWVGASLLGIGLANLIPQHWGLGFAGILALVGVASSLASSKLRVVSAAVAGAAAVVAFALPLKLNILVAICVAVVVCLSLEKLRPALLGTMQPPAPGTQPKGKT